ncbi:MAG TPA: DUF4031 domain-containing protein [Tetrasphaera sp.]|uniref:DUF4031 domain-containing protein n=1 Tax=Nostocoides sp. TaxID=1917966 RepID=UPI002B528FE5|nr:DUF4031 domain-containing protein [Tetrasphaera sp.]HNQ07934.1 DUF4031 domain-containing protein [Tetrasphaera sp.]
MTIWIDRPAWPAHGRLWSHLISDISYAELHDFAAGCGIPRRGFEGDHYDVPEERYAALVAAGAQPTTSAHIIAMLQQSGLRLRKRKGEKGIARVLGVDFPDGSRADVDLVRSTRVPPDAATFAAVVYVRDDLGRVLSVYSRRRAEWSAPGGWREPGETPAENAAREMAEETGVRLDPAALVPVGYERFHPLPGSPWPVEGGRFLAIFTARVTGAVPEVVVADGEPARWLSVAEFLELSAGSWWLPGAEAVLAGGG